MLFFFQESESVNLMGVMSGVLQDAVATVYRTADFGVLLFKHCNSLFSLVCCYIKKTFRWCRLRHKVLTIVW